MKVICKSSIMANVETINLKHCTLFSILTLPLNLDKPLSVCNSVSEHGWFNADDPKQIAYSITIGRCYKVYGILLAMNQLRFLIQDDTGTPLFAPSCLFDIIEKAVFFDWEVAYFSAESDIIWIGDPEMANDYSSITDLLQLERNAIKKFIKYKDYVEDNGL